MTHITYDICMCSCMTWRTRLYKRQCMIRVWWKTVDDKSMMIWDVCIYCLFIILCVRVRARACIIHFHHIPNNVATMSDETRWEVRPQVVIYYVFHAFMFYVSFCKISLWLQALILCDMENVLGYNYNNKPFIMFHCLCRVYDLGL